MILQDKEISSISIISNSVSDSVSIDSSITSYGVKKATQTKTGQSLLFSNYDQDVKPDCRISDFWFFQCPRGPGCVYSQGRADWGDKSTAPPEVRGGYKISYASDIYAFGLCVLQWARCANQNIDIDLDQNTDSSHIAKKGNVKAAANDIMLGYGTVETRILPPPDPMKSLGSLVHSRWGSNSWVQRMLRMMLPENPRHRATAKEILTFLRSVTFEET